MSSANDQVAILINDIPRSTAIKFAFGPIIEIIECFRSINTKPHLLPRTIIHGLVIVIGVALGVGLSIGVTAYRDFVNQIAPIVNLTAVDDGPFTYFFAAWLIAYPASWLIRSATNIYSLCRHGDTEFFLEKDRLDLLAHRMVIDASPDHLEKAKQEIDAIFRHVQGQLRFGESKLGARSQDLIDVLNAFMNREPEEAMLVYKEQKKFYKIYLWMRGDTATIFDPKVLVEVGKKFRTTDTEIRAILEHCVRGMRENSSVLGSRKEDYLEIIENILEGNDLGLTRFNEQQQICLQLRIKRENDYKTNLALLTQLRGLLRLRKQMEATVDLPGGAAASRAGSVSSDPRLEEVARAEEGVRKIVEEHANLIDMEPRSEIQLSTEELEKAIMFIKEKKLPQVKEEFEKADKAAVSNATYVTLTETSPRPGALGLMPGIAEPRTANGSFSEMGPPEDPEAMTFFSPQLYPTTLTSGGKGLGFLKRSPMQGNRTLPKESGATFGRSNDPVSLFYNTGANARPIIRSTPPLDTSVHSARADQGIFFTGGQSGPRSISAQSTPVMPAPETPLPSPPATPGSTPKHQDV